MDAPIDLQDRGGKAWLILTGVIDVHTVETYSDDLSDRLAGHDSADDVWVDLSRVEFMDSTGLSVLFRARNVARAVHLVDMPVIVETLLARTGTVGMFQLE